MRPTLSHLTSQIEFISLQSSHRSALKSSRNVQARASPQPKGVLLRSQNGRKVLLTNIRSLSSLHTCTSIRSDSRTLKETLPKLRPAKAREASVVEREPSVKKRETFTLELLEALRRELVPSEFSIEDVSMYRYAPGHVKDAPMELVMMDDNIPLTCSHAPPPASFVYHPPVQSNPIHNASAIAHALCKLGFTGSFYEPQAARIFAQRNGGSRMTAPTTDWPDYTHLSDPDEYPRVAQLFINGRQGLQFDSPVSLTLPSAYVLPRFSVLQRIYQDESAQILLSKVWQKIQTLNLVGFTPTTVAIMVGSFVMTNPGLSYKESYSKFLRLWSQDKEPEREIVTLESPNDSLRVWRYRVTKKGRHTPRRVLHDPSLVLQPQPEYWKTQPLIVRDPYAITQNHAEGVSERDLELFLDQCAKVLRSQALRDIPSKTTSRKFEPFEFRFPATSATSTSVQSILQDDKGSDAYGKQDNISEVLATILVEASIPHVDQSTSLLGEDDAAFISETFETARNRSRLQHLVLSRVRNLIKEEFGSQYSVASFGSSRYGISTATSDVDIVILDPAMKSGFQPGTKPKDKSLYAVRSLAHRLKNRGFKITEIVARASVPIVKFRDLKTGQDCDICVNERLGFINTHLIEAYCQASPLLRPMLLLIKLWAKPRDLNSPGSQTRGAAPSFSSYAFALMTIGFLQTRGLLPNLQGDLPPLDPTSRDSVFWALNSNRKKSMPCDVRYHETINGWCPQSTPSLREIMQDWFQFWSQEFSYADSTVSIRHGRLLIDDEESDIPARTNKLFRVLDPFIADKNVVVSIGREVLRRFTDGCHAAGLALQQGTPFRDLAWVPEQPEKKKKVFQKPKRR